MAELYSSFSLSKTYKETIFLFIILLWLVGIHISMATLTLGNTDNIL